MRCYPHACSRSVLITLLLGVLSLAHADEPIRACSDTAEWPPYSFRVDDSPDQIIGISVDLLQAIFTRVGVSWQMELLPWKRCLHFVAKGQYQVVTDASVNEQRERDYLISDPAYSLTQALFYDRSRFPDGPPEISAETISQYRLGGIAGYNYDLYQFDSRVIDTSVDSYADLLELLRRGRFDFAIGIPEVLAGLEHNGMLSLVEIGQVPIPGVEPLLFHYLLPRSERGAELKRIIDQGLVSMRNNGCYQRILEKYGVGS